MRQPLPSPMAPARCRRLAVALAALALLAACEGTRPAPASAEPRSAPPPAFGVAALEPNPRYVESEYSRIRLEETGSVRTLWFIRDSGEAVVETRMDLTRPDRLLLPYTRWMFTSYLLRPEPERVLIVGLGGGSMVRFLEGFQPGLDIDAVEIDPAVVEIADRYFGTRSRGHTRILTADAFAYLAESKTHYDVIYMDAFLKPTADTDPTGVPLRLKTLDFYAQLRRRLSEAGLVVFNLNEHRGMRDDVDTIFEAFPTSYLFAVPGTQNAVVLASTEASAPGPEALAERARALDASHPSLSFGAMLTTRIERD